jgi:3-deoxy-D-manno-octulosonate 8-phosphate phosphatase (KDO 8-P phosphatase)
MMEPRSLRERCAGIEILLVDVDGVLTAGGIGFADDGTEQKLFHVRDGTGLKIWEHVGKKAAVITGRTSLIVTRRAAEVGVGTVIQGATAKLPAFRGLLEKLGIAADQACFVGDDLPDLPVMRQCGLAVAVADACPEVLGAAHLITRAEGGHGAVREAIECILRCQGHWQSVVERLNWFV